MERRWGGSFRSTPTPRATRFSPRSRQMPTGTSWWSGRATARAAAIRTDSAFRGNGTRRVARRWGESSRSTPTPRTQSHPAISLSADGDFVVVWESGGSSGGDTGSYSIQGQRYTAGGVALGGQFQVNAYTTNQQFSAAIALDADGDFVVVWESNGSSDGDTSELQHSRAALRGGWSGAGGGVSGQRLHHGRPVPPSGLAGCRRGLRGGLGQRRLERRRHVRPQHSGAALRGGWSGVGGAVSGQRLHHERPVPPSGLGGCRRGLRGGLGQRRFERRRHVRPQHSGAALRGGWSGAGGAVSGQRLHHEQPDRPCGLAGCRRGLRGGLVRATARAAATHPASAFRGSVSW